MEDAYKDKMIVELARKLTDRGLLIEAGWTGYAGVALPINASPEQVRTMRTAFFAGAIHLFFSIIGLLQPGTEPTETDFKRMEKVETELRAFQINLQQEWEQKQKQQRDN